METIDETLLRRFEAGWNNGHPEALEDLLPPETDAKYLPTLEELVHVELELAWEDWTKRRVSGNAAETKPLTGPLRVEDYIRRFPQLDHPETILRLLRQECLVRKECGDAPSMEEYRERFPHLVAADWEVDTFVRANDLDATIEARDKVRVASHVGHEPQVEPPPQRFGNHEILGEIGRGGMGVVYRARQLAADRIVALKVVRRDLLRSLASGTETSALDRFQHEVQAAARLEHENIVTVHEVGDVDGEPYFSMQYVDGHSLDEALRDGPLPGRQAAKYIEPVARAVHEAHRAGILHRDLKPQNILVDSRTDRPLVADFGLAKLQESDEQLTQTGDIMGSPPYMSPEQAQDSSTVTALSDVYGLGATLYHLLTWRPPFRAATGWETLRQVIDREPVPPRQLNPSIDKDLETICLKCLDKEPSRRYESALELAEDLRRFLDNQPIRARPIGNLGRAVRWCRRNPVVAGLMASTAVAVVVALVAMLVGYIETTAALKSAEKGYAHARGVVNKFYTRVSEDKLLNQPGMQPLRQDLLQEALDYYRQLLDERGDDPTIQDELAMTHFRIGRITELIESPDKALDWYQRALEMQERLIAERPEDIECLTALGDTWNGIGGVLSNLREFDEARKAHRKASEFRARLAKKVPKNTEFRRTLANSRMNIGLVDMEVGLVDMENGRSEDARSNFENARLNFEDALNLRRRILDECPDCTETRRDMGIGYYNMANLSLSLKDRDHEGAETNFKEAISLFEGLLAEDERDLANQYRLAMCYRELANLHSERQQSAEARERYGQAFEQIKQLVQRNPDVPEYEADLAGLRIGLGQLDNDDGRSEAALESFRQAVDILQPLSEENPGTVRYRRDLVVSHGAIVALELANHDTQAALEHLRAARDHLIWLTEAFPDDEEYRQKLQTTEQLLQQMTQPEDQ